MNGWTTMDGVPQPPEELLDAACFEPHGMAVLEDWLEEHGRPRTDAVDLVDQYVDRPFLGGQLARQRVAVKRHRPEVRIVRGRPYRLQLIPVAGRTVGAFVLEGHEPDEADLAYLAEWEPSTDE